MKKNLVTFIKPRTGTWEKAKILIVVLFLILLTFPLISCLPIEERNKLKSASPVLSEDNQTVKEGYLYCFSLDGKIIFEGQVKNFSVEKFGSSVSAANTVYSPFIKWNDLKDNFYQWNGTYFFTTNSDKIAIN